MSTFVFDSDLQRRVLTRLCLASPDRPSHATQHEVKLPRRDGTSRIIRPVASDWMEECLFQVAQVVYEPAENRPLPDLTELQSRLCMLRAEVNTLLQQAENAGGDDRKALVGLAKAKTARFDVALNAYQVATAAHEAHEDALCKKANDEAAKSLLTSLLPIHAPLDTVSEVVDGEDMDISDDE